MWFNRFLLIVAVLLILISSMQAIWWLTSLSVVLFVWCVSDEAQYHRNK